jgi:hypothetical protein
VKGGGGGAAGGWVLPCGCGHEAAAGLRVNTQHSSSEAPRPSRAPTCRPAHLFTPAGTTSSMLGTACSSSAAWPCSAPPQCGLSSPSTTSGGAMNSSLRTAGPRNSSSTLLHSCASGS